jgi:hypothetical protein
LEQGKHALQTWQNFCIVQDWSGSIESPSVGAIGTPESLISAEAGAEAERRELDWLLTPGVLGRSGNLTRVLKYICEERFTGRANQIKEYSIATEALGRRPDFDPNSDTIVRVTVHSLRKRLLEVYQNEGADRPMRLMLPPGHYDPQSVPAAQLEPPGTLTPLPEGAHLTHTDGAASVALDKVDIAWPTQPPARIRLWRWAVIALCVTIATSALWSVRNQQNKGSHTLEFASVAGPLPPPQAAIRALMGSHRQPYVDHSGVTWVTGNYCQGEPT